METYAVGPYNGGYGDIDVDTLFWGALTFVAFVVCCLLAWKAIEWIRNRFDGVAAGAGNTKDPEDPWDKAISRPSADFFSGDGGVGGLGGMSQREQGELFSTHAPRKVRQAMKARRKAREQARNQRK
jgi:hypothetical protein